ncbi:DNA-binding response regulator [Clostridia bacterium]|nr:DNA-binding response regulator [Clostridia bacterium]
MKIAICDDNEMFRETLEKTLRSFPELPGKTLIKQFSSGDDLIENYNTGNHFDIIFLDIEMPGRNGLETGNEIRRQDEDAVIIFLTSFDQYIYNSLKIEVFDYLLKPAENHDIHEVLQRALTKYQRRHCSVEVKWQETRHILQANNIVYVEGYYEHVTFYTNSRNDDGSLQKYKCVAKLDDYAVKLSSYGFLQCHQSFLVNMKYITDIGKRTITLSAKNGQELAQVDMSTRKKQDCLREYGKYLARRGI